ncbi:Peptidyl-tRNA hydrolase PTH2 domain-containing protein [Toxoplasma gondii RUB]|uniref:peptidyl-tRNA hydrolase n=10 Tax=Toxoplasma gondii TaxID=5811 RepID=A0A125YY26_TOXGV|nr:Peptidyl-tRNA hydrolase PTH2 domain-containing protein [Toxoplasma gondii GT1]ESS28901.1 Peptidyl-tRNA hydrolase PTH2 domain-containing protein [Toxoplasma gondii VEG]KAF4638224.1 Peptidyl-tRNA hydrolase PTH2 domain-containing protein [Toxoplasma gondii]KFG38298.1 Peptidyl-tRNA hydrolase PTH2 domain-containing protein [Toxoplasma gondii p89]KFG47682.1 Peptidyl-tRNA hydrolase PTH2 domain-containing protein [Toxoplasma gondii GAB2-2007-GAL-DOM2]KFG50929.1 Peptidyl-tRNA hydrolase PTH2 domain-c
MWRGNSSPFQLSGSCGLSPNRVAWKRLPGLPRAPLFPSRCSLFPSSLSLGHPKRPPTITRQACSVGRRVETITKVQQFSVFLKPHSTMNISSGGIFSLSSDAPSSAAGMQTSTQHQQADNNAQAEDTIGVKTENGKVEGTKEKRQAGRPDPIVQYVLLRKDLQTALGWPTGAVIAQACHACISVVASAYSEPDVQAYLAEGDNMRKVVLEVHSEEDLRKISETLDTKDICHKLWIEQPEGIPTCVAIQPMRRSKVNSLLKSFKLYS